MNNFKGTPGPWFKTPFANRGWLILRHNLPICHVKHVSDDLEDDANAQAIACLLEMIAAFQELLRFESAMLKGTETLQYPDNFLKAIPAAKAALSKALTQNNNG